MHLLKNLKDFGGFVFEQQPASTVDFIRDLLLKAASGPGTDEELLLNAILSINDERTLIKINQSLNKEGTYKHLQDLLDDELGFMDGFYKSQILAYLRNKKMQNSTAKVVLPTVVVTKDQVVKMIRNRIIKSEGFVPAPYKDTKGIWTIGIGFNIQTRNDVDQKLKAAGIDERTRKSIITKRQGRITKQQAEKLLDMTISEAYEDAKRIVPSFTKQPLEIQGVLVDMTFNIGPTGLKKFSKFINYVDTNQYAKAADEMKKSLWYRQVGDRAKDLESIVRSIV